MTNREWVENLSDEALADVLINKSINKAVIMSSDMFNFLLERYNDYPVVDRIYRRPFEIDRPVARPKAIEEVNYDQLATLCWLVAERNANA